MITSQTPAGQHGNPPSDFFLNPSRYTTLKGFSLVHHALEMPPNTAKLTVEHARHRDWSLTAKWRMEQICLEAEFRMLCETRCSVEDRLDPQPIHHHRLHLRRPISHPWTTHTPFPAVDDTDRIRRRRGERDHLVQTTIVCSPNDLRC